MNLGESNRVSKSSAVAGKFPVTRQRPAGRNVTLPHIEKLLARRDLSMWSVNQPT